MLQLNYPPINVTFISPAGYFEHYCGFVTNRSRGLKCYVRPHCWCRANSYLRRGLLPSPPPPVAANMPSLTPTPPPRCGRAFTRSNGRSFRPCGVNKQVRFAAVVRIPARVCMPSFPVSIMCHHMKRLTGSLLVSLLRPALGSYELKYSPTDAHYATESLQHIFANFFFVTSYIM